MTTLRYAAALRLPSTATRKDVDAAVDRVLADLGLEGQANVRVGQLSGGQRKRASIAVELLTQPRYFFLDQPDFRARPDNRIRPRPHAPRARRPRLHGRVHHAQPRRHRRGRHGGVRRRRRAGGLRRRACRRHQPLWRRSHRGDLRHRRVATARAACTGATGIGGTVIGGTVIEPGVPARTYPPAGNPPPKPDCGHELATVALSTERNAAILVRNRLTLAIMLGACLCS